MNKRSLMCPGSFRPGPFPTGGPPKTRLRRMPPWWSSEPTCFPP